MAAWQTVTKKDLPNLKEHYLKYEPYCHLNIVDMWGWRVDPIRWFKVGDSAVYRLNDYNDDSQYLTILGKHDAKQAVKEICLKNRDKNRLVLKCLPQETLTSLKNWGAVVDIKEDEDNHNYIYEVNQMINLDHVDLRSKRKTYRKFKNAHPHIQIKSLEHNNPNHRRLIYRVFKKWAAQKGHKDHLKELRALKRMLNMKSEDLVAFGFFNRNRIIGYTLNQPEPNGYYQAFSGKADRSYPNLGLFMEYETARLMHERFGSKHLNLQPDQGIAGLRDFKKSLKPSKMLNVYTVVIDVGKALKT